MATNLSLGGINVELDVRVSGLALLRGIEFSPQRCLDAISECSKLQ